MLITKNKTWKRPPRPGDWGMLSLCSPAQLPYFWLSNYIYLQQNPTLFIQDIAPPTMLKILIRPHYNPNHKYSIPNFFLQARQYFSAEICKFKW